MKRGWLVAALPLLVIIYLRMLGFNIPAVIYCLQQQFMTGAQSLFGLSLLLHESLGSHPSPGYVKLGYFRAMKLKYIYLMRFLTYDNYLYSDWLDRIHNELLVELEARDAPKDEHSVFEIPTFDYETVDPQYFLNEFVRKGRPAILRNTHIKAANWTTDNLMQRFPDFIAQTRCNSGVVHIKRWTLREYVQSRNGTEVCYLDNNAELFEQHPELVDELELYKVAEHMAGEKGLGPGDKPKSYFFSQIFLAVFSTTGALYHGANYNNLFFMIQGKKKWTFVDPSNSFLIYPMFNGLMRDTKSFLTWHVMHAKNSTEIINQHFPLYRYCPKYTATLEPGDLLINPPWNWHMVENIGTDSIGVASRWKLAAMYPYTNGQFSFQQFISPEFWSFLYHKAEAYITGIDFKFKATSHQTIDDQMNFGRLGSVYRDPRSADFLNKPTYEAYVDHLQQVGYIR